MIASFKDRRLQRFYETGDRSKLQPKQTEKIGTILASLDAATRIEQLNLPTFRLHPLRGDLKGSWSITVKRIGESCSASRTARPSTSS